MGVARNLRNFIRWYPLPWFRFANQFVRKWPVNPLSLRNTVTMFRKGFYPDSVVAYNFRDNDCQDYLSDLSWRRISKPNGKYSIILNDKILFERVLRHIVRIPINYSLILGGTIVPIDRQETFKSLGDILDWCSSHAKVVLKPSRGDKGRGVMVVSVEKDRVLLNHRPMGFREFGQLVSDLDGYMITEYIEQGSFANGIFPDAVNTARILTMISPSTLQPLVAGATLRIGTRETAPLDNMSRGGLGAYIEPHSGILGRATRLISYSNNEVVWYDRHPDTNEQIRGRQIPNWDHVVNSILAAACAVPFIPYIGWDVCLCDEGVVVIEGNSAPGFRLHQMHAPLLKHKGVRNYCKHHNIC